MLETKSRRSMPHAHYAVGIGIRKRLEQYSVNHTENGAVRADADSQRQQCDGSEKRGAREPARNMT